MNIRPFEIALIGIFGIAALGGLLYLSVYQAKPDPAETRYGERVEIWGSLDGKIMKDYLQELTRGDKALEVVKYTQIDSRTFERQLLNAIAEGRSPDLVIMPHDLLVSYRQKLQPVSYETIDERTFKDTYIDGAEIFMLSDGVYGIPFAVDPLIMYWNRDMFSNNGLALPPRTWETLTSQTIPAITRVDDNRNIIQSAVALGEYANIRNAKEILSALFFQTGSTIVDEQGDGYVVTLNKKQENTLSPGDAVLSFYTKFALPVNMSYTWNRSLYSDHEEFVAGKLALYFGKASERDSILRENPNLNVDVAPIPQGSGATIQRNYADFYALTIPRASTNMQGAYAVALVLSSPENAQALAHAYDFAPVRRSLYNGATGDAFEDVVRQSALIARGWLDPLPEETDRLFRDMVEGALAGQSRMKTIIIDTVQQLESLF